MGAEFVNDFWLQVVTSLLTVLCTMVGIALKMLASDRKKIMAQMELFSSSVLELKQLKNGICDKQYADAHDNTGDHRRIWSRLDEMRNDVAMLKGQKLLSYRKSKKRGKNGLQGRSLRGCLNGISV